MSLINILKKRVKVTLFTTPSHSQRFFLFPKLLQFYKYDISEVDAYNPQEALKKAQNNVAKIYGTKATYFLTNGSTSGIIAAVLACVKKDEKVLIWDKAHQCHLNAVKLAGAEPVFYKLDKNEDWDIYLQTKPETIESALKREKIKAVIVTSPSYEGIVSDIEQLSKICKKHSAYLIVDEAHGALYPFCDKLPQSAIYQGADFVIQSLHKTAGGLNPTALLHCNICHCEAKDIGTDEKHPPKQSPSCPDIQAALDKISTTSPSYPLLASIEKNINFLNSKKGRVMILNLINNIYNIKKNLSNYEFYGDDPTKILLKSKEIGGEKLSEILFNKYKIEDEKSNLKSVLFLCGIGTNLKKLKKLKKSLTSVIQE